MGAITACPALIDMPLAVVSTERAVAVMDFSCVRSNTRVPCRCILRSSRAASR
jgi:hypothetical protein